MPQPQNNTVTSEGYYDLELRHLRQRMEQNRREFTRLITQLESLTSEKPRRENRGLFTKKILAKVEERFPSRPGTRRYRRQKR